MKFKVGSLYYIRFDDHTSGNKRKLADSQCVGWCIEDQAKFAVFTWWLIDDNDKLFVEDNHEPFTLAKSAITGRKLLKL